MGQKILVMLPNNLGDVIMATPVLEGLKRANPESQITFFVEDGYEGGIANNPFCDSIFQFKRSMVRDLSRSSDWPRAIKLLEDSVADLKNEGFDRIINLSQHEYVPYIVSLLSCPNTIGREFLRAGNHAIRDAWSQYLYAIPFARRYNSLHATDVYKRIAGIREQYPVSTMTVTEAETRAARAKITAHGWNISDKPVIVMQPGAAFAAKRWPLEHFVALGKRIVSDGFKVLVTGAPQELEIAGTLATQLSGAGFSTAGILSFRETIALLPLVKACVTGDTAIMHAAAALKRKVFALFGPTNPVETGPYSEDNVVICGRCAKRPCFCFDCKSKLCMKSILPDDVYSCMKSGRVGNAGCDIYTTSFRTDGTWALNPVIESGPPFFSKTGALLTRMFLEPDLPMPSPVKDDEFPMLNGETDQFLAAVQKMAASLEEYLITNDKNAIRSFETHRVELAVLTGVGAFWTAILNLRLNSIPMLDPGFAVRESKAVCLGTETGVRLAAAGIR